MYPLPRSESKQPARRCQRPSCKLATLVLAALAVSLSGCSEPPPPGTNQAMNQRQEPKLVRVGSLSAPGTPWHDEWLRFEASFDEKPDAGLELNLFISGQLGSEETVLSNLRRGRVQLGGFSLHGLASVVP
jgi:TRAP-type C4-dicarboxylate transport system substrate-binding protein